MRLALVVIVAAVAFYFFVRFLETHSVYFPMKQIMRTPKEVGLEYDEVFFKTSDGVRLHGWYVGSNQPRVLLFCHGNAGNISHRVDKILLMKDLGADIFLFDYRGYGRSEGRPSERGLYRDAEAAYEYLISEKKRAPESIVIYGESIGGAVGTDLATKRPVAGLITEETFTSVPAMARIYYPIIPPWFIQSRFDALSKIRKVPYPKLIFHSVNDEIVPFRLGQALFKAAG